MMVIRLSVFHQLIDDIPFIKKVEASDFVSARIFKHKGVVRSRGVLRVKYGDVHFQFYVLTRVTNAGIGCKIMRLNNHTRMQEV